jgi:hypothetical protein
MRTAPQFSVFLVNQPGVLAKVVIALAKAKINITALTLVDSSEHGVLRIVCQPGQESKVRDLLKRTQDGFTETDVLCLEMSNEPGSFAAAAQRLADAHINITYAYCTGGAPGGRTTAVFKVADLNKALKVLKPAAGRAEKFGTVKTSFRR